MYHNPHFHCDVECDVRVSYIRIEGKWTKIGYYNTGCKTFEALESDQEKEFEKNIQDLNAKAKKINKESKDKLEEMRKPVDPENTHFSYLNFK